MSTAQPGIFAVGTRFHHHLELALRPGVNDDAVVEALRDLREAAAAAVADNVVLGFGPDLWRGLAPEDAPDDLTPFTEIRGEASGRSAPATQRDVWVWVHGAGPDSGLDTVRAAAAALDPVAVPAGEQPCFVYRDSRDLTGFVDGTENPAVDEAADVALVPEGEAGEGGAFAMTMKWVHDLTAWEGLTVVEQEAVIGRTKPDSVELDDDVKPATAHVARVVIEDDGEELEIYRRSVPYGTLGELGLYFVAFSADPTRFQRMLARMFGTDDDGLYDHLVRFSTPVSGSHWFVPSLEALADLLE